MHTNTIVSLLAIAAVGFVNASPVPKTGVNGNVNGQSVPPAVPANVGALPKGVPHVPRKGPKDPTGQTGAQVDNVTPPGPNSTPAYIAAYHDAHGRRKDPALPLVPITPFDPTGTSGVNIDDLTPPTPGGTPAYIEAYHVAGGGKARRDPSAPVSPPALPVKAPVKAPSPPALPVPRGVDADQFVHPPSHLEERVNTWKKPSKNSKAAPKTHLLDFVFSKVISKPVGDMVPNVVPKVVPKSESIKPIAAKVNV